MGPNLKRREDWPEKFDAALLEIAAEPFAWGSNDCLQAAAKLIAAMTDIDLGAKFRGQYQSQTGALRLVAEHGCASIEQLLAQVVAEYGMQEIGVKMAHRGDLVVFDTPEGAAFGVVHLNGRDAVCVGEDGLKRVPVLTGRRAWRVPF